MERHLDRHDAPLTGGVDDRSEREPVAHVDRVADVARLERGATERIDRFRGLFGHVYSPLPGLAQLGLPRHGLSRGVLGGRPNGRPSRGRHGAHHGRVASAEGVRGRRAQDADRARERRPARIKRFALLFTAAHGGLLSSRRDAAPGRAVARSSRQAAPESASQTTGRSRLRRATAMLAGAATQTLRQ